MINYNILLEADSARTKFRGFVLHKTPELIVQKGVLVPQRDDSLDAMKGLGCVLMILAHSSRPEGDKSAFLVLCLFLGNLAPLYFFAVSGITATFQATRTPLRIVITFYALLSTLGISYNLLFIPDLLKNGQLLFRSSDILQVIALGSVSTILIEKYFQPRKWVYPILGVVIFLIHSFWLNYSPSPPLPFPLFPFIFVNSEHFTSFTLIPWIFAFFLGIHAYYNQQNEQNFKLSGICFCALVGYEIYVLIHHPSLTSTQVFDKWQMSPPYFLLSGCLIYLSFYLFRKYYTLYFKPNNLLVYLGKYSLLFLYVHLLLINALHLISDAYGQPIDQNSYLIWILVLAASWITLKGLQKVNVYIAPVFQNSMIWVCLLLACWFVPLLFQNLELIRYTENLLGILFASHYNSLSSLIKQKLSVSQT